MWDLFPVLFCISACLSTWYSFKEMNTKGKAVVCVSQCEVQCFKCLTPCRVDVIIFPHGKFKMRRSTTSESLEKRGKLGASVKGG